MANYPKDERLLVKMTRRPQPVDGRKFYTVQTGAGDDIQQERRTIGSKILLDVSSTDVTVSVDIQFLTGSEKIYLHQGFLGQENAGWGDMINCDIWSNPSPIIFDGTGNYTISNHKIYYYPSGGYSLLGTPVFVPNYGGHGWQNLVNSTPQFSPTQTGIYDWYDTSIQVNRFVNCFIVYGTNYSYTNMMSDESEEIPPNYFIRVTAVNISGTNQKAFGAFNIFREYTIP